MDVWGRTTRIDPPTGPAVGYVYDVKGQLVKAIRGTSAEVGNCLAAPATNCLEHSQEQANGKISLALCETA